MRAEYLVWFVCFLFLRRLSKASLAAIYVDFAANMCCALVLLNALNEGREQNESHVLHVDQDNDKPICEASRIAAIVNEC